MPGIAIIKCHMCWHKGPLLRGGEKAVTAWLKQHGWGRIKGVDGICCPACVKMSKKKATGLDFAMRRASVAKEKAGGPRTKGKTKKARRRQAPKVEVLTETHVDSKFRTQDRVLWDASEYKLGKMPATVIAVRDKLGKWRYKIRLDTSIKKLFGKGAFREVDVPQKNLTKE